MKWFSWTRPIKREPYKKRHELLNSDQWWQYLLSVCLELMSIDWQLRICTASLNMEVFYFRSVFLFFYSNTSVSSRFRSKWSVFLCWLKGLVVFTWEKKDSQKRLLNLWNISQQEFSMVKSIFIMWSFYKSDCVAGRTTIFPGKNK